MKLNIYIYIEDLVDKKYIVDFTAIHQLNVNNKFKLTKNIFYHAPLNFQLLTTNIYIINSLIIKIIFLDDEDDNRQMLKFWMRLTY